MSRTQDSFTKPLLCACLLLAVLGCSQQTTEAIDTRQAAQQPEAEWLALSQIVIQYEGAKHAPPEVTRTKEQALELASEISMQVRAGGDYVALAKEHSDDSSGQAGGYLGVFYSDNMEAEIAKACKALAVGGVSDPVETKFGFHVVRRDHEVEIAAARHILVTHTGSKLPHPDRTKEQALARAREAMEKINSGIDLIDLVSEYSEGVSVESGGDLGSFPEGINAPEIDEAVFKLELGEISPVTETPYGFHIFQRYE